MKDIAVIDYGCGNILSVVRAFEHLGYTVAVITSPDELKGAQRIVIPGVGAFSTAARRLEELGIKEALLAAAASGTPILGICLGMQLLFTTGYEHSESRGLGLIKGEVRSMALEAAEARELRLPEVGWRKIRRLNGGKNPRDYIFSDSLDHFFYFVHSFEVIPQDANAVIAGYNRGERLVVSAVARDNIFGVQYHPEKSGQRGLLFLNEFATFIRA